MQRKMVPVERLQQIGRNVGLFWALITLLMLAALTAYTFVATPALLVQPRGWLILGLSLAYGVWFVVGQYWFTHGDPGSYHHRLMRRQLPKFPLRTVVYCTILFATAIALGALSDNFRFMLYTVYGMIVGLFAMPWAIVPLVPVVLVLFAEFNWLPQKPTADEWIGFLINLLVFCIYTAILYLPFILLSGRFERERMFADLEQSHAELADAHRRLAEAAGRDREIAVLRERERLAREMHDTLGHALVLANVKLEAALRLRPVDPERADHEIVATQQVLRETMGELRASLADLRTSDGCNLRLSQALESRAREAAVRAGWDLRASFTPDADEVSDSSREALLRVGVEAIANAEHHAHARIVEISAQRQGDEIVLRITDDGIGLGASQLVLQPVGAGEAEPSKLQSPPGHYGITGMVERVEAHGGCLTMRAGEDGHGTIMEARMPVSA